MLRDVRELFEIFIAWRIFQATITVGVALMALLLPVWLNIYIFTGLVLFLVFMVPFAVVWAIVRLLQGLRDSRYTRY
jgi:hypothetical protein